MGTYFWSQSGCNLNGHTRPDVWWYYRPDLAGCWYYRPDAPVDKGPWWVSGPIFANFAAGGHECGGAGAPTDAERACSSGPYIRWQRFETGRFVVTPDNVAHYQWSRFASPCTTGMADDGHSSERWLEDDVDVPDPPKIKDGKAANGGKVKTRKVKRRDLARPG